MIVKRTKIAPGVDWLEISNGKHTVVVLHPDEATDMARIIFDLVNDIRHEQGLTPAQDALSPKEG